MKVLSLGAGVQSSALALMAEHGDIEKPDYAIFADTGWEPNHVYSWLDYLISKLSFPVIRVSAGNIRDDLIRNIETGDRFASIPFYLNGGMGRRQCTSQYKLQPIFKKVRELLGYQPSKRIPAGSVQMYIGISLDEVHRMKPSREIWISNRYPLIDLMFSRIDCLSWMDAKGYPLPPKSSCVGCPFHNDSYWMDLKRSDPDSFSDAVRIDNLLRSRGPRKFMNHFEYMHRSRKPLADIDFTDFQREIDFFGMECEGICGT
ncbi:hypothetical protein [Nitrosomonas sp.]|uniref:hypothetical protein n=1 Tax=Nitrosomonas sp. TaxID=42353 RepID=UPI0033065481